ncbi:MAG: HlyD family efflux transporter periplasmic adaptor subunit [Burkholderiaceae bacterium]
MIPLLRLTTLGLAGLLSACSDRPPDTFQGYVEGDFVYVASAVAGQLEALRVARGDEVKARSPLYRLDSVEVAAVQRAAQEELVSSQARLADLQKGKRPREVDVVIAQLNQARADAEQAAIRFARDQQQVESGAISRQLFDEDRALASVTAARVKQFEAELAVARLPARADQIQAQAAQVEVARAVLDQAVWRLGQVEPVAPQAARVVDTLFRPGEWVAAGKPVVKLLAPADIKLRFFVPETRLAELRVGQALLVSCDGCGGPLPARLSFISPVAEYTPPVIYSNETRAKLVFMVEARPAPEQAARLHPGQPVSVALP